MKKKIALFLAGIYMVSVSSVLAFTFPEPDWGALLNEKTQMVSETDFELYVEGSPDRAQYYGAKNEPKAGTYFGIITENSDFISNQSAYLTYFDMDYGQTDIYYPANDIIKSSDAVVTIGYTVNSLDRVDYDIIRKALDNLASYNKPMFIRFANEMNVSSLGDDPTKYVDTFRRVADIIHQYPNFAVVWSPNDMGALDRPFDYFYPGDEYVDWIGVSSYMKKYFQGRQDTLDKEARYFMTGDYAWTTNALKPIIKFMSDNNINKPVMISEGGVATENNYGEDLTWWAIPRLRNMYYNVIMKYPQVKLINYFNTYRAYENEKFFVWDNFNAEGRHKQYAMDILNEASVFGAYIKQGETQSDFVFEKADKGSTLKAVDGIVNLYTLAHIPSAPYITVNYSIDGVWYHSSQSAPYTCGLNISALSDGEHTVEISSQGLSKAYTFYKSGDYISFGGMPDMKQDHIKIMINGSCLHIDEGDVKPFIAEGRTLVPLRVIFEALGAEIEWIPETSTVIAKGRGKEIIMQIDNKIMTVNNQQLELDVPAQLVEGRTVVPARAVAQSFGCTVDWDGDNRTVIIQ